MSKIWKLIVGVVVVGVFSIATSCEKETDFIEEEDAPATDYMTFQFELEDMIIYDNPIGVECGSVQSLDTLYGVFSDTLDSVVENQLSLSWLQGQGVSGIDPNLGYERMINGQLEYLHSSVNQMSISISNQSASLISGTFSGDLYDSTQTFVGSFTGTFNTPAELFCE